MLTGGRTPHVACFLVFSVSSDKKYFPNFVLILCDKLTTFFLTLTDQNRSDYPLLHGIRNGDRDTLLKLYREYFPGIRIYLAQHHGSEQDAKDVFQEGLVILHQKCSDPKFELRSSIKTYLFAICKHLWMRESRNRGNRLRILNENFTEETTVEGMDEVLINREKEQLFYEKFEELNEECRKLLKLFFVGRSMNEIAREHNYSNEQYARKRKFLCKKKLLELVKSDHRFAQLQNKR